MKGLGLQVVQSALFLGSEFFPVMLGACFQGLHVPVGGFSISIIPQVSL